MELRECYQGLSGDFDAVLDRLRSEQIIRKFVFKFLDDTSFSLLRESMANQNEEDAFRAAHTLKGVCQNLSFTLLYHSTAEMTEALRAHDYEKAEVLFMIVSRDYDQTVNAIIKYRDSIS